MKKVIILSEEDYNVIWFSLNEALKRSKSLEQSYLLERAMEYVSEALRILSKVD